MIQRLLPVLIFAAVAIVVIQFINYSFTKTYESVEATVKTPYAKAQQVYESELNNNGY